MKKSKKVNYKSRNGFLVFTSPADPKYRAFVTQGDFERLGAPKCPKTGKSMVQKRGYK